MTMKNYKMAFNGTDELFVTAMRGRETLLTSTMSGITSIGEVFRHVRNNVSESDGLVMLYLRNTTQGWAQQHTLLLKRA